MFSFGSQANQLATLLSPCINLPWLHRSPSARSKPSAVTTALFTAVTENSGNSDQTSCPFNKSNHPIFNALDAELKAFYFAERTKTCTTFIDPTVQFNSAVWPSGVSAGPYPISGFLALFRLARYGLGLTFREPCIVIFSYNESQRDALLSDVFDKVL
jgi:hypothetical protein